MKVKPVDGPDEDLKIPASGVEIELTSMKAGYLRSVLNQYTKERGPGFASDLFYGLDRFWFQDYEERFPGWKDRADEEMFPGLNWEVKT